MSSLNDRRRFLQLMGASLALSGASGCRWKEDRILPHAKRPAGLTPGQPREYATAVEIGGTAAPLVARSYDGRPVKIEGNALAAAGHGGSSAWHQASVLELYDPDRSRQVRRRDGGRRRPSSWDEFAAFARAHFADLGRSSGGEGLCILSEASSSPSLLDLRRRVLAAHPRARWFEYEPLSGDHEREGSRLAFGEPHRVQASLDEADVVLCLDADPLGEHPAALQHAAAFAARRDPEAGPMSRLYVVESSFSLTGGVADHRLALRSGLLRALTAALDGLVSARAQPLPEWGPPQPTPDAAFLRDPAVQRFLGALARDLLANVGHSVVLAGARQPPEVHALVHRLNRLLGNAGRTVKYTAEPDPERPDPLAALGGLVRRMRAGQVHTLVMLGGNPVYAAPADLAFGEALGRVGCSIHLSLYDDETSQHATWHLPRTHYLETWGDGRTHDGTLCLAQPLIAPLREGRSVLQLLALIAGQQLERDLDLVRHTHATLLPDDRSWRRAVHDGLVANTRWPTRVPELRPLPPLSFEPHELGAMDAPNGELELVLTGDAKVHDGRFANNAWLQELPDPVTKLCWGNSAWMAPALARRLGVRDGTLVELEVGGRRLTLPAVLVPGQAPGSVRVTLGYGRTAAGQVGGSAAHGVEPVGVDAYALRTTKHPFVAPGLRVRGLAEKAALAAVQPLHSIDEVGRTGARARLERLVPEATLEQYRRHPGFARPAETEPEPRSPWRDPAAYDGHRWGLCIDLSRCTGCGACIAACQAENNVPVVGREQVLLGREMHWLRVDRYFAGTEAQPVLRHQPVPCQHCENAPCEQVCPVGATLHSREGLNEMAYHRCIGARYCSNNCPYKVRRFNYFDYHAASGAAEPLRALGLNPEVSVRSRGVMEKCSLCVQRIEEAKTRAKLAGRSLADGEIQTACQQACPADAIVFGDLADGSSQVARRSTNPRSYALLEELHTRPRIRYLARVRNPNPELG